MTTIVLTDVDDVLIERLRLLASVKHRTVEQQARVMLEEATHAMAKPHRAEIARAIAAMTPQGVRQTDSVVLLREDRDRDDHDAAEE